MECYVAKLIMNPMRTQPSRDHSDSLLESSVQAGSNGFNQFSTVASYTCW